MTDHIYKQIEITGTSSTSIEEAVNNAISRADASLDSLRWFEVTEIRGAISKGEVDHWQVTSKIGFTLQDTKD